MDNNQKSRSDLNSAGERESYVSGAGCAVRLSWLIVGPVVVAVAVAVLASQEDISAIGGSSVYWGAVLAMLVLRYVDVAKYDGLTAEGEPASMTHFRRYALRVGVTSAMLYGLALWFRT